MIKKKFIACITILNFTTMAPASYVKKKLFPEIQELFPTRNTTVMVVPPGAYIKNFSLDVETIDLKKFKKNFGAFKRQIMGIAEESPKAEDVRRAGSYFVPELGYERQDYQAVVRQVQTKTLDCMLQTIYMARHHMKRVDYESGKNKKNTNAFRAAYLYRKMIKLYNKIVVIYAAMVKRIDLFLPKWRINNYYLIMHHNVFRLHVDLVYIFWVIVNINDKENQQLNIRPTVPEPYL